MVITTEEQEPCNGCGEVITIRQYEGMPGRWWTEHVCGKVPGDMEHAAPVHVPG